MKRIAISDALSLSQLTQGYMRLNSWELSAQELIAFIEHHLSLGITTVDHSPIYGNYSCEKLFGKALRAAPELRNQLEIVSKCGINLLSDQFPNRTVKHYDYSKQAIVSSCEQSLVDLHTDVIDMFLLHRPSPLMHFDEVLEALTNLLDAGKIKTVGVSNFLPLQLDAFQKVAPFPVVTNQIQVSFDALAPLSDGTLDDLQARKVIPMLWSPFAGGTFQSEKVNEQLRTIAEKYNCSIEALVTAWLIKIPNSPIPIIGSGNKVRIAEYAKGCSVELSLEDWFLLYEAGLGRRVA